MSLFARAALFTALFTLCAAPRLDAQSKITVTLTGGAHAGKYEMEGLYCEMNPNQFPSMEFAANSMGAKMDRAAKGESIVGATAPSSISFFTASAKGKPDGFVVDVVFHAAGKRTAYEIFAIPREMYPPGKAYSTSGSGTLTVKETATGKTASFRGQTKDGVKMEGIVDCRPS